MRRLATVTIAILALTGCQWFGLGTTTFTFTNESSFEIAVTPNGQSWDAMVLFPGDERIVEVEGDEIYFTHSESDWYRIWGGYDPKYTTIKFVDADLATWTFDNQSSYTLSVSPQEGDNAQDWEEFEVASGDIHYLEIPYTHIYLLYSPADLIELVSDSNGTFTAYDL